MPSYNRSYHKQHEIITELKFQWRHRISLFLATLKIQTFNTAHASSPTFIPQWKMGVTAASFTRLFIWSKALFLIEEISIIFYSAAHAQVFFQQHNTWCRTSSVTFYNELVINSTTIVMTNKNNIIDIDQKWMYLWKCWKTSSGVLTYL